MLHLLELFAVGTTWFWILTLISSIIFIASIEHDHYTTPSILALILGILYWKAIAAFSWQTIGITVGVYALVGVLWSMYKWYRHVNKAVREYRVRYGAILSLKEKADLSRELSASSNKSLLTGWIAWWPWSFAWGLTGDFFNGLYDLMANAYQRITDHAMSGFTVDDPTVEKSLKKDGSAANW